MSDTTRVPVGTDTNNVIPFPQHPLDRLINDIANLDLEAGEAA